MSESSHRLRELQLENLILAFALVQVHFPRAVCLTGVKIGAVHDTGSYIHVFARDLDTRGSARFACLAEKCSLPDVSVKAVRVEVSIASLLLALKPLRK